MSRFRLKRFGRDVGILSFVLSAGYLAGFSFMNSLCMLESVKGCSNVLGIGVFEFPFVSPLYSSYAVFLGFAVILISTAVIGLYILPFVLWVGRFFHDRYLEDGKSGDER